MTSELVSSVQVHRTITAPNGIRNIDGMLLIAVAQAILATVRYLLAEQRWPRRNCLTSNYAGLAGGRIVKSRSVICGMQYIFDVAAQCRLTPRNVAFPVLQNRSRAASHLHQLHLPKHPGDEMVPALHVKQVTLGQNAMGLSLSHTGYDHV